MKNAEPFAYINGRRAVCGRHILMASAVFNGTYSEPRYIPRHRLRQPPFKPWGCGPRLIPFVMLMLCNEYNL
jgi:hypothetical protein